MPLDQAHEGRPHPVLVQIPCQDEGECHVVDGALRRELVEEPQRALLLGEGQRSGPRHPGDAVGLDLGRPALAELEVQQRTSGVRQRSGSFPRLRIGH